MLAMNRHGPFSEYELTAENESPSLFLFLGKAGGCSCSCAGAPATGSGALFLLGDLGTEVEGGEGLESQRWRSHYSRKAAVIPSFRKREEIAKNAALLGTAPH